MRKAIFFWFGAAALAAPAVGLGSIAWAHRADNQATTYATLSIAYLTVILVGVTAYYAWMTRRMAQLMQQDLEQRSLVEVYVRLTCPKELAPPELRMEVNNLSAAGIWVERVEFYAGDPATMEARGLSLHRAEVLVPAFDIRSINIQRVIWGFLCGSGTPASVQARVKARVRYRALGAWRQSEWAQADVHSQFGDLAGYGKIPYCVAVTPR